MCSPICTVENSANVTIRDSQFRGEGLTPAEQPETAIMIVQSRNVVVTDNSIYRTGLGIFVCGGRSSGNRISANTITAGPGFAAPGICYNPTPTDSNSPRGDLISGNVITGYPTSLQFSPKSLSDVAMGNSFIYITEASPATQPTWT